jgi:hypothetical protein
MEGCLVENKKYYEEMLYLSLIVLTLISIYLIAYNMFENPVIVNLPETYSAEQIEVIDTVIKNADNRVSNIIGVSAIFFTVIVTSISVFQFIKIKEADIMVKNISQKALKLEDELSITNKNVIEVMKESTKLEVKNRKMKMDNIKTNLELNMYKIRNAFKEKVGIDKKCIDLVDETIRLSERYPELLSKIDKAELYYNRASFVYNIIDQNNKSSTNSILKFLQNGIEQLGGKETRFTEESMNLKLRDTIESIYLLMIDIEKNNENYGRVDTLINDMGEIAEDAISECISNLAYTDVFDVNKAIDIIKDNMNYYGEKFKEHLLKKRNEEWFLEHLRNEEFNNLIQEIERDMLKQNNPE